MGATETQYLAQALHNNTVRYVFHYRYTLNYISIQTLTTIILQDNRIGAEGAQHLARALENNTV